MEKSKGKSQSSDKIPKKSHIYYFKMSKEKKIKKMSISQQKKLKKIKEKVKKLAKTN